MDLGSDHFKSMMLRLLILTLLVTQCILIGFSAYQVIHGIDQLTNLILIAVNVSFGALNVLNIARS
jgi:hypothetical protein